MGHSLGTRLEAVKKLIGLRFPVSWALLYPPGRTSSEELDVSHKKNISCFSLSAVVVRLFFARERSKARQAAIKQRT